MVDEETNDIFKDFKFESSDEPSHDEVKKQVQKEFDKHKFEEPEKDYKEEIRELKEQVREIKEHVKGPKEEVKEPKEKEEKPEVKHVIKHIKSEPKFKYFAKPGPGALERGILIGIIVILSVFIIIDLTFYHKGKVVETVEESKVTGMVVDEFVNESEENKTLEEKEEVIQETIKEENDTAETKEEKVLSGTIDLKINKIYKRKESDDKGYITKVSFTIKNGKNEILKPVVRVYAYDKSLEDTWVDKPRGIFNYTIGIMPGDEQAGSIDLTPKTFRALNTIKTVILQLSDENDEVITSAMEKFYIE